MEATDWHNCIFWRPENVASYLTKGKQVFLEGRRSHRSYEKDGEKRYATEVVVEDLTLLGGGEGGAPRRTGGASSGPAAGSQAPPSQDPYDGQGITDDDLPF